MALNISLKEYATLKNSTVNDVIQFASEKGVVIPNETDYLLDDSILKQIDPIFHHKMKYGQLKTVPIFHLATFLVFCMQKMLHGDSLTIFMTISWKEKR